MPRPLSPETYTPAGARFGHAAAAPPGVRPAAGGLPRLYLFGGVVQAVSLTRHKPRNPKPCTLAPWSL